MFVLLYLKAVSNEFETASFCFILFLKVEVVYDYAAVLGGDVYFVK